MAQIILVRHAQASLGKANYDELSKLGFLQADLLGKYLSQYYETPSSITTGTLTRHLQTAEQIKKSYSNTVSHHQNPDWNEFNFQKLISLYLEMKPDETPQPGDIRGFFSVLKHSMLAWAHGDLDCKSSNLETWEVFSNRINRALNKTLEEESDAPQIIISSGGAIAVKLMQILETSAKTMINLNFQIRNTSFSELLVKNNKINLVSFNQINHLIESKKSNIITYA